MKNITTTMTKKISLAATFCVAMLASSTSFAHQFDIDAQGDQAIKEHKQLMSEHMQAAEQDFSAELNQDFDQKMQTAEQNFMKQTCAKYGLDFDTQSEACDG